MDRGIQKVEVNEIDRMTTKLFLAIPVNSDPVPKGDGDGSSRNMSGNFLGEVNKWAKKLRISARSIMNTSRSRN